MSKINDENIKLDEYEQDLEDNFEKRIKLPPDEEKKRIKMLVEAAKEHRKNNDGKSTA